MDNIALFISDRALSLQYEAMQFPAVSASALAWLRRAESWAERNGYLELKGELEQTILSITTQAPEGSDYVPTPLLL